MRYKIQDIIEKIDTCCSNIFLILIFLGFIVYIFVSIKYPTNTNNTSNQTINNTAKPTLIINNNKVFQTPTPRSIPNNTYRGNTITWKCIDSTSFDGNAYNDNKCTSSAGEVRYVSDSQAISLDPSYRPSKSGDPYYNNK